MLFLGLAVCVGLVGVLMGYSIIRMKRPTDTSLVQQFQKNRTTFEELKQMLLTDQHVDQVARWGVSNTNSPVARTAKEAGLSEDRYKRYLELLKRSGASAAIRDGHEIRFHVAGRGFASKGWRISITWTDAKPERIIASLDDFRKTTDKWEQAYRPLEHNWYLWIIW